MKRYVNVYKDSMISNTNWNSRIDAETFPILDRELVAETVRILNAEEEKEFAWEWYKRNSIVLYKNIGQTYTKEQETIDRDDFEQLWKEQE